MDVIIVPLLLLLKSLIGIAITIVVTDVILSWLAALNIINTSNRIVYAVIDTLSKISNFMLDPIRARMPSNIGSIDISPVILLILLTFLEHVITRILLRFV